jgi:hypothetical protein
MPMSADLKALMESATSGLTPRPDLLAEARAGGRRRVARRRSLTAGAALAVALAVPVAVQAIPSSERPPVSGFAGPLSDGRGHGDLADDRRYVNSARSSFEAWRTQTPQTAQSRLYARPVSQSRVVWAGTTPAGPAALLAQRFDVPDGIGGVPSGVQEALAYIGTGLDGPRVAAVSLPVDGLMKQAWYVDPEHRVLAVVDAGRPRGITYRWDYRPDGTARRTFEPLVFSDGVATVELPEGVSRYTVHVSDLPHTGHRSLVEIANVELDREAPQTGVGWNDPTRQMVLLLPIGDAETTIGPARDAATAQSVSSRAHAALEASTDQARLTESVQDWFVYGRTPDGSTVSVFERQLDNDPARLYALIGDRLLDLGPVDRTAPLPVQAQLPDGQGWVVAQYQSRLQYRVHNGPWRAAGQDAALLPDLAAEVLVTGPSGQSTTVRLKA